MIRLSTRRVFLCKSLTPYFDPAETLIVWTEPDGVDYALSFQDPEGCAEVWHFIEEVQRHMNTNGECTAPLQRVSHFSAPPNCHLQRKTWPSHPPPSSAPKVPSHL